MARVTTYEVHAMQLGYVDFDLALFGFVAH
jgi:hypothetical protein